MTVLDRIVADKRAELAERMAARPLEQVRAAAEAAATPRDLHAALHDGPLAIIAEIKRRSPSKGALRPELDPADTARLYGAHGAAAISVLTESRHFGGSDDDLRAARAATALPALRKDFTLDAYQLYEARAIGADAVLLIASILAPPVLAELIGLAQRLDLAAIVEVHDAGELAAALDGGAAIVGINNRDLKTFEVSLETCLSLRPRVPSGIVTVAESGVHTPADIARIAAAGFDAALIGESLLATPDPGAALAALVAAAKEAAR